jgi:hypothetical protein
LWITSRVCMGDEAPNCGLNSEVEVCNVSADLQYQRPCAVGVRGHEPCEERRQGKSYECRGPTANYVCGRILYQNQVFSLRHSLPHFRFNPSKAFVVASSRPIYASSGRAAVPLALSPLAIVLPRVADSHRLVSEIWRVPRSYLCMSSFN